MFLGCILPLVALLPFVYFSEMMNYVIGPVGPKFGPAVSKELNGKLEKTSKKILFCYK